MSFKLHGEYSRINVLDAFGGPPIRGPDGRKPPRPDLYQRKLGTSSFIQPHDYYGNTHRAFFITATEADKRGYEDFFTKGKGAYIAWFKNKSFKDENVLGFSVDVFYRPTGQRKGMKAPYTYYGKSQTIKPCDCSETHVRLILREKQTYEFPLMKRLKQKWKVDQNPVS